MDSGTTDKIVIDVARMDAGGETFEGEADVVDLDEELVHPFGGVRYSLKAQLFGDELLVRGRLEQDFDLVCCRCGKDFDTTIKVEDFSVSFALEGSDPFVDISDEVRQAVLVELPAYPICDEKCGGIEQKEPERRDSRWDALDALGK
jgi:uncharacterized metal-binding protein YceD (DUF177 family)